MGYFFQLLVLSVALAACDSNLKVSTSGSVSPSGLKSSILTYDKATSAAPKNSSFVPIGGQCTDGDIIGVRWSKENTYIQETPCQDGRWNVDIPIADFETHDDGLVADIINKHGEGVGASLAVDLDLKVLRPTVTIDESVALLTNASAFTLSGTCSAWGQNVEISGAISFSLACENGQWRKIIDLSEQADGTLTFIAHHKNATGWPAVASIRNILKDTVAPTASFNSLPVINIANANNYTVSGLCSENDEKVTLTGFVNAQVPCSGGAFTINANTSSVSDGATATITAMISDKAGNSSTPASASTTKDVTAPTVTINMSSTINSGNQANFPLSGTCSENGRSVSLSGGLNTTADCNSGVWNINFDFTAFDDGNIAVHAIQSDDAGNTSSLASRILIKSTGLPVVTIDPMIINMANEANGPVTGTCSVTGQNVVIGGDVAATVLCVGGVYSANVNFSSLPNGNIAITADHSDADGNNATQATRTFVKDSTPPSFTSLTGAHEASNGYINASEVSSNQAMFFLNASGYAGASYTAIQNNNPSVSCATGQTYDQPTIPTINTMPASDASYVICVRLVDTAGNTTYGKSQVIVRDTMAPTINVGLDVIARSSYNLDASSTDGTIFLWSKISGPGIITFSDGSAEDTSVSADADGSYVLRLTVTDVAGNTAFDELNFEWDTTAPIFTSLVAINEASDGFVNASEASSSSAMFQLSASDYTTAHYSLPLDNSIAITCDVSKAYGQSVIPAINALPASDKPYVVCVKLEDIAGNITYGKSAVVTRDVTLPTVNVGSDVAVNSVYSINATTTEGATYAWTKTSGPGSITFGAANAEDTTASADTDGTYVLRLTVTDAAGNSAFDELTMVWNTTGPVFSSLAAANQAADGYINAAETSSIGDFATLVASDYTVVEFTSILDNNPAITCDAGESYALSSIPAINTIPATDGDYVICVRLADAAGNVVYGKSTNVVRDTVAPTMSSFLGANQALDGFINASEAGSTSAIAALVASGHITADFSAILDDTPSITCDGAQDYPNNAIPGIDTIPAIDDSYAVCVKLTDTAGNITYGKSSTIVRDTAVPTVNVGLDVIARSSVNINASSTGAATFAWSQTSGPGTITFGDPTLEDTSVVASADGSYVLRLTVTDVAGNTAFDELNFEWDTTAPIFTSLVAINEASDGFVNASEASSSSAMFQLSASDYTTAHYSLPLDNSIAITCDVSKAYGQSVIPAINALPASDKPYVVCVKLEDIAGNITYGKSVVVTRDVTPPTVNVGSDVAVNSAYAINATSTGASSFSWSTISGPGTITFGDANVEDTTASASTDGSYVLRLTVTDLAGNSAYDELTMTWNTTGPAFTSLAGANQAADGYINSSEIASNSPLFVLTASNYTGVQYSPILDDSSPQTCDGSQSYSSIPIPLIDALPAADKPYVICVRLSDAASNIVFAKSQVIVRDTAPPTVNVGLDVVKNGIYSIDASSTDGATFSWTMQSGPGTITFGSSNAEDTSVSASTDGTYVLRLTVFDAAGNSAFDELDFTLDTQAPVFTSLVGANEASNGYINASEASSTDPIVSLSASSYATASYTAILDNTPSITCDVNKTYSNPSIPAINTMPAVDDTYAVCVQLVDVAGNITYGKSQSIVRDTLAPSVNVGGDFNTSGAISINATTVDAATFTWTQRSGPGTVTFGNSNSEDSGASADMDGTYVLRLTVADAAGNSAFDELTYIKDTMAPAFGALVGVNEANDHAINASEASSTNAVVSLSASDYTIAEYSAILDNTPSITCNAAKTYVGTSVPAINTIPAADDDYAVCVKLSDAAGNVTYGKSSVITRDVTPPTFTSLLGANQASNGYINASEISSASAVVTLSASNYTIAEYTAILDNTPSITCDVSKAYLGTSIPIINTMTAVDDTYAVCVRLRDAAGNITYGKSPSIVRMTTLPTVSVGSDITSNNSISIDATTSGAASFAWTKQSGSGTITFGTSTAEDTSASADADDTYVLRLTVADVAGNSAFDELTFIRDTQAPTFTSLLGANEASNGFINASETSSVSAIVSLVASNYTTANYTAILDNTPSITCDAGKTYSNSSIPAINSMTAADDSYAVCVRLVDTAGNTTYGKSQSIVRDTLAPSVNVGGDFNTSGAISINATTVDAASFTWTQQSGPGVVTFGNPSSEDTGAGASLDGTYVLRLTVLDAAGNSAYDELTYVKDTVAPTFTSLVGANAASDNYINASEASSTSAIVALSASDYTTAEYTAILDNTPSVTCNAGKTYVGTSIPAINTMPAADDDYVVCVKLSDAAGNVTYGKSAVITRDTAAPIFSSLLGANQASNGYINASEVGSASAVVTLSASNYTVVDYTAILDDTPSTVCDASKTYVGSTIPAINTMPAVDDTYAVCVRLRDAAGNITYGKSPSIVRMTTLPTVSVGSDITSNNSISIDATTSGAASFAWAKQSGGGTITFGTSTAEDTSASASTDGTYVLRLTVTDIAGNTAFDEMTYVFDTTPPVFTFLVGANEAADGYINNSEKNSTNPIVALTASNYSVAEFSTILDNTPSITCDASKSYPASVPAINSMPAADDSYAVCVRLTDTAGNITYGKSSTIVRDIAPPVFTLLEGAGAAVDGYLNASEASDNSAIVTLSASNYDTATYTAILDNTPSVTCDVAKAYSNGTPPLINTIPLADDSYAVCVKLADTAGNITYGKSQVIVLDLTAPVFTSLLAANQASDGYINASETAATGAIAILSASDYTVVKYTIILDNTPSITCDPAKTYGNTSIPAINTMPITDDSYAVCVRLTDAAGNNTYGKSQTVVRDTTPPTVNVGADLTKGALFTIDATTGGATTFSWTRTSGPGTVTFGAPSAEDTTVTASAAGTHVLRLTVTDIANNSANDEMTLIWDITPPTFTSLVAANAASDGYINASETSSTNDIVTLTASDYTLAEYSGILDNTPSITCDNSKSYLSTSIPKINTMPAADDTYAVCVKLSDAAGNVTYGKSGSIVRDVTPPTFTSLALANQASDGTVNIADITSNNAIVSAVSGSNFTTAHYVVALSSGTCSTESYSSTSLPLAGGLSAGLRKVCVRLGDAALNYTYGSSSNFTVDTTVPTVNVGFDVGRDSSFTITPSVSGATTYQWSVTSGTAANISFGSPTAATTTVSASAGGEYVLRLTASTASGNSAYDELYLYWLAGLGNHVLFVTSTTYTGNLGGLSGADAKCNARATAGGLTGNYKALVSTSTTNAKDRVTITSAVVQKDGTTVATGSADFWDGPSVKPSITESGTPKSSARPWTGSNNVGVYVSGKTCADWTDGVSSSFANQGYTDTTSNFWFGGSYEYYCNYESELYCLQDTASSQGIFMAGTSFAIGSAVDLTFNLPPNVTGYNTIEVKRAAGTTAPACNAGTLVHTWTGPFTANSKRTRSDIGSASTVYSYTACVKNASNTVIRAYKYENVTSSIAKHLMFHTSTMYAAGALGGIAGADAKCQTAATNANLPGTYKAMLSTSTTNVKDRIAITAPVYNRANQLMANDATDLWDGTVANPNLYTEAGATNNYYAVTGSTTTGLKQTGYMCGDWTNTSGTVAYAITQSTSGTWLYYATTWNCADSTLHLYCISQ